MDNHTRPQNPLAPAAQDPTRSGLRPSSTPDRFRVPRTLRTPPGSYNFFSIIRVDHFHNPSTPTPEPPRDWADPRRVPFQRGSWSPLRIPETRGHGRKEARKPVRVQGRGRGPRASGAPARPAPATRGPNRQTPAGGSPSPRPAFTALLRPPSQHICHRKARRRRLSRRRAPPHGP